VETSPSGSVPSSTDSGQELPFAGAPKVTDPLDTTRFQKDPCQALTADQAQSLGTPPTGKPRNMPFGNACEWKNPDTRAHAVVHFLDRYPYGLSTEYQAREDGKLALFQVLPPIEGYPAVVSDVVDPRPTGACTVVVGVSDEIAFEVPLQLSPENIGKKDPCEIAAMVAGMALQTMKKG